MSSDRAPEPTPSGLSVLVVDDEPPALGELAYLLSQDERIGRIVTASSGTEALQALEADAFDVIFSDINMPGLDGLSLARVIARFATRPQIVFVTAYDEHAVDAFAVAATDYVMKPVRAERLTEAVRRAAEAHASGSTNAAGSAPGIDATPEDETIAVELGGVTRFIQRSEIRYALAQGDYARLYTSTGSHLVRIPLSTLEQRWEAAGFVRIHRSTLVSSAYIEEVRVDRGRCSIVVDGTALQVSRRHTRALRDKLVRTRGT